MSDTASGAIRPLLALARTLGATAVALLLAGCGGGSSTAGDAGLRVLFVGNSLTATNDLPGVVETIGAGDIAAESVAPAGVSLEEQWSSTGARERLEAGGWDAVVLQQGPSSLPESRAHLRRWAVRWARLARSVGARPAVVTVWPETARSAAFPAVVASYAAAAEAAGATLLPAGEAWRRALARDPALRLYGPDGFHPSELGTALAALVVLAGLTGTSPGEPALPGVEAPEAALLRRAAADALAAASLSE